MKVILSQNVPNLGDMGSEVNVSPGYARNFLFPRKLAVQIDSASAQQLEHERRIIAKRETAHRKVMEGVAATMSGVKIELTARVGEEGKLFGSVTTANIAAALKDLGHEVDRRNIKLESPIKTLGSYEVAIRLAKDVDATVTVEVNAEEVEAAAATEAEESTALLDEAIAEADAEEDAARGVVPEVPVAEDATPEVTGGDTPAVAEETGEKASEETPEDAE